MSDDAKIQRLRDGYQPGKNEATKSFSRSGRRGTGMDGYQPTRDELTKGYRVTQQVDMSNLKIPKNLGDAAVMPRNSGNPVRTPVEPQKD